MNSSLFTTAPMQHIYVYFLLMYIVVYAKTNSLFFFCIFVYSFFIFILNVIDQQQI